eukprot:7526462-Karenia_brevis.AAC.1
MNTHVRNVAASPRVMDTANTCVTFVSALQEPIQVCRESAKAVDEHASSSTSTSASSAKGSAVPPA